MNIHDNMIMKLGVWKVLHESLSKTFFSKKDGYLTIDIFSPF